MAGPLDDDPLIPPAAQRHALRSAVQAGLQTRPLAATVVDTLAWVLHAGTVATPGGPPRPAVGLTADREAAVLAAWSARRTSGA